MKTCPFCAEEIQDAAVVCKHCGRELGPLPQSASVEYEYFEFEYYWPVDGRKWTYAWIGAESKIRLVAWQEAQRKITDLLEPMLNQGWGTVGEPGAGCITVTRWDEYARSLTFADRLTGKRNPAMTLSTIVTMMAMGIGGIILTFATFGFALIPILIIVLLIRVYAPVKFQIRLRRRKSTRL